MLIKKNKEWNNYKNITPEKTFINRRSILKSMGFAAISSNIITGLFLAKASKRTIVCPSVNEGNIKIL